MIGTDMQQMAAKPEVFISYATGSKPFAQILSRELEKKGLSSWADFKDLKPGQRWQVELDRAVNKASLFLILVGPGSSATPQLEVEWQAALRSAWDSGKALIPVIFGDDEVPPFLRSWVGIHVKTGTDPSTWTERVIDALTAQPSCSTPPASPLERSARNQRLDELAEAAHSLKDSFGEADQ
jgi:TIR domain-containing protein